MWVIRIKEGGRVSLPTYETDDGALAVLYSSTDPQLVVFMHKAIDCLAGNAKQSRMRRAESRAFARLVETVDNV